MVRTCAEPGSYKGRTKDDEDGDAWQEDLREDSWM